MGKTVEITVAGDFAFRSGTYTIKDKSGATADSCKYLQVWRKSGGKWQIVRDMWNSDTLPLFAPDPPPGAGA
jgi:ketosteroid isomerase-like protein